MLRFRKMRRPGSGRAPEAEPAPGLTRIGASVTVHGHLTGGGQVRISGRLEGDCTIEGPVFLEPGGRLEGMLSAIRVEIGGELAGGLLAREAAVLTVTGRVDGDVRTPSLTLVEGARVNGFVHTGEGWSDMGHP